MLQRTSLWLADVIFADRLFIRVHMLQGMSPCFIGLTLADRFIYESGHVTLSIYFLEHLAS